MHYLIIDQGKRNPTCDARWLYTCTTHPSPWKFSSCMEAKCKVTYMR